MTKLECLHKMVLVWSYLSLNPYRNKSKVYEYLGLEEDHMECPCCEFCHEVIEPGQVATDHSDVPACCVCPLADYWPKKAADIDEFPTRYPCTLETSEFFRWYHSPSAAIRQNAAQNILAGCFRAINEIILAKPLTLSEVSEP